MTQIPPRGTPEFEEYKKHVEEAHRKGARIQIWGPHQSDWMRIDYPAFNGWDDSFYRIAPDQSQSAQNQAPAPAMTPTEQRIVKALDRLVSSVTELEIILSTGQSEVRMERLAGYNKAAFRLVDGLLRDLPPSSPSPAPSEATAPAVEAGAGGSEAVAAFKSHGLASKPVPLQTQVGGEHYQNFPIQPVEFITANKLSFLEGCVVKRICRHRNKNGIEDLRKAIHEIELLIELEYGREQA